MKTPQAFSNKWLTFFGKLVDCWPGVYYILLLTSKLDANYPPRAKKKIESLNCVRRPRFISETKVELLTYATLYYGGFSTQLIIIHTISDRFILDNGFIQHFLLIHSKNRLLSDAFQMNHIEFFK